MNKKTIEYLIIATAIIILLYSGYAFLSHDYIDEVNNVTDSITMYHPASSNYTVIGDTVVFKNPAYSFYDMNVSKLSSNDARLTNLLSHFSKVNQGTVEYFNESCYVVTMEFEDASGFKYHSMIIPIDSFDKNSHNFTKDTTVYLFDANNRGYLVDSVFNSKVIL
ncbi:MAG: hypothetical protein IJL02_11390 [Methanobrevibacter sp.]|uniref:hypothetical protein n=1 Tax=Methanobrevibacter sp. TaxID=66852 RepID=UPI0025EBE27F|nr:hypothetical protein [Methanobrevibacter sp.]MBQ6100449.1 hypothetical protein [Methanobrevibacter sp.]